MRIKGQGHGNNWVEKEGEVSFVTGVLIVGRMNT